MGQKKSVVLIVLKIKRSLFEMFFFYCCRFEIKKKAFIWLIVTIFPAALASYVAATRSNASRDAEHDEDHSERGGGERPPLTAA